MSVLVCYCLAARLYKASGPNVPLMLSFSESVATASSVVIRFVILFNKSSVTKIIRSLTKSQTESTSVQHVRNERIFFCFGLGGVIFTFCLSMMKALAELRSINGFQMYKKAYLFSADVTNQTLDSSVADPFVWTSHLLYIANLYGVPGLSLIVLVLIPISGYLNLRSPIHQTANPMIILGSKLGLGKVKIIYIATSFSTLATFYAILSVWVARIHESVNQMHDEVVLTSAKHLSIRDMTAVLTSAREFVRNTKITGWGVFVIDRNFLLTSVGMVISYGVILMQFS
ncbi:uncharacterized protein CEXT_110461 [Caerostris extrusa]|uniref:Gustatory receptor n=1 Tax=Caerostris extrusa TaxID=172846 RepID=A0AAV4SUG6_CAEEX|nr:uncharacterized protein CEXT_110461 [Caerostris extrusa]